MTPKRQRLWLLIFFMLSVSAGVGIILNSFNNSLIFFYTPTQLQEANVAPEQLIRIGGLVEVGSVERTGEQSIQFTITDTTHSVTASYTGLLPNLFREGQGVVAEGTLQPDGSLMAKTILAKHDENYMPQEVADELKKSGRWQHYSDENIENFAP